MTFMLLKRLKPWNTIPMDSRRRLTLTCSAAEVLAVEPHVAGVRGREQVNAAQQGGLAGAGGADDGDDLARHDLEVHAAQDVVCAEKDF